MRSCPTPRKPEAAYKNHSRVSASAQSYCLPRKPPTSPYDWAPEYGRLEKQSRGPSLKWLSCGKTSTLLPVTLLQNWFNLHCLRRIDAVGLIRWDAPRFATRISARVESEFFSLRRARVGGPSRRLSARVGCEHKPLSRFWSGEISDNPGADYLGDGEGESLPCPDAHSIFWILGIQLRELTALGQPIHPMQRNGFATPLHFEFVSSGTCR